MEGGVWLPTPPTWGRGMKCICIAFAFQGNVFEIRIWSGITFEDGCLTLICRLLIYILRRSLPRHSAGVGNHAATARLPGRQPLLAHFIQSPSSHDSVTVWLGRKSQRANRAESGPVVFPSSWRYNSSSWAPGVTTGTQTSALFCSGSVRIWWLSIHEKVLADNAGHTYIWLGRWRGKKIVLPFHDFIRRGSCPSCPPSESAATGSNSRQTPPNASVYCRAICCVSLNPCAALQVFMYN